MHRKQPGLRARFLPILVSALFASISPLAAQQTELKLDPAKTRIDWTLGATMHTVEGSFRLKSGDIVFNPKTGEASGELIVDATSGDSGNKKRDADMNKNVLESAKYPEIVFFPKHVIQIRAWSGIVNRSTGRDLHHPRRIPRLTLTVPFK